MVGHQNHPKDAQDPPFAKGDLKRAFTLIELLVVISIISLLSSIVLASLAQARVKARNTWVNEEVGQYLLAAKLAFEQDGTYPIPGVGVQSPNPTYYTAYYCLGDYPGGKCWDNFSGVWESSSLKVALSLFIPGWPADLRPLVIRNQTTTGFVYRCENMPGSGGPCPTFSVIWRLEGPSPGVCGNGGSVIYTDPSGNVLCEIYKTEVPVPPGFTRPGTGLPDLDTVTLPNYL